VGGLIITGDITSLGKPEGFTKAEEFIVDLNRNLTRKLISENIIFCPGNHDFVRKNEMLGNGVPEKVSENPDSISAYKEFYSSIHNLNPNEYMACGRRLLMSTGRTVEIVALNSLILQQYKDFEGHGFLSDKQLEYVANKMGWEENVQTNSVRIVIMHHHYMPTCLVEQVDVKKPSSVVYDAERLVQWLAKYDIKLLLHGHKHQSFVSKIGHFDNSIYEIDEDRMKNIYVIGMGGTGAFNCENKFSTLTFCNDHIELKFFRIYADNTETDKCVQTLRIPI
jgi:predicted phosphodiesterase